MINDNILIKLSCALLGYTQESPAGEWVDHVKLIKWQIQDALGGFPGIGLNDLSVHTVPVQTGRVLLIPGLADPSLDSGLPPLLVNLDEGIYDGIGRGYDGTDIDRTKRRWRGKAEPIDWSMYPVFLTLDTKDTSSSVYYYFHKFHRDARY